MDSKPIFNVSRALLVSFLFLCFPLHTMCSLSAATIEWDGGGDGTSWHDRFNWVGDVLPGVTDDVVINIPESNPVIKFTASSGNRTVKSIVSDESLELSGGSLTVSGGASEFRSAFSLTGGILTATATGTTLMVSGAMTIQNTTINALDGAIITFQTATSLTNVNLSASDGGQILFPVATTYADDGYGQTIQASGSGSQIDLSGLVTFDGGDWSATKIKALGGGTIALGGAIGTATVITAEGSGSRVSGSGVRQLSNADLTASTGGVIEFPVAASYADTGDGQTIQATGTGSRIDLSGLATFDGGDPSWSATQIKALSGGTITLAGQTTGDVVVTADGAGSQVRGGGVTKLSDVDLTASAAGVIEFPAATSYADSAYGETIQATGTGSRIDLSGLATFDGGDPSWSATQIKALSGAVITLSGQITGDVVITADGAGSQVRGGGVTKLSDVDLTASAAGVIEFLAATSYTDSSYGEAIQATGTGSRIDLSGLATFDGGDPSWSATQIKALTGGTITLAGQMTGDVVVTADGAGSQVSGSGVTKLSNVDLTASAGGVIEFPSATSYTDSSYGETIQASGAGSRIDLSRLATFEGGDPYYSATQIKASSGGTVALAGQLSALMTLTEDGAGSVLDLSAVTKLTGISLTAANGATWVFPVGWHPVWGSGNTLTTTGTGSLFINLTTLSLSSVTLTINTSAFTDQGVLDPQGGGVFDINGSLTIADPGLLAGASTGTITISGDLFGDTHNADRYAPLGLVQFDGSGTAASPQQLEVMGRDLGEAAAGFNKNFVYSLISLSNKTYVRLIDLSDNAAGADPEALYVNSLIVPTGTTLDVNGLHLYTRAMQIAGTIVGGTITQIPDSGPIVMATPTPGSIGVAGELDEWTFFGLGGRFVTIVVNPGSSGSPAPLPPYLNWVQVELLNSEGKALGSASGTSSGQIVSLNGIQLPSDGMYKVQVRAAAGHLASTGNYMVTIWDTTADVSSLVLNKQVVGTIENPYSVDRWEFSATANTQVRFDLVNRSNSSIVFDFTGPGGWKGFTNLAADSDLITLPASGAYAVTAHGTGGQAGGFYAFRLIETSVTDLSPGIPYAGTFTGSSQAQLFQVVVPQASPFIVTLDDSAANNINELYAKFGTSPTRGDYDYCFANTATADQHILVPMAYAGTWYILVYGDTIRTPSPYTLTAETAALILESVTPDHHGNAADAVLTIRGAGFDTGIQVSLVAADSTMYPATSVAIDSSTQLTAVFAAKSVPAGTYDLFLAKPDGSTAQLLHAFEVIGGGEAKLKTNLILPSSLGYHATATLYVEYSNTGDVAMPAPLLSLSATQNGRLGAILTLDASRLVQGFWTASMPESFSNSVQFLASGEILGTLQPGESGKVPIYYAGWQQPWDFSYSLIDFSLGILTASDSGRIDWGAFKDSMRPSGLTSEQWETVFNNLVAQVGSTWGDYVKMLDDNAFYLHQLGERVTDIRELLSFETMQASGLTITRTLASAMDTHVHAPGLLLTFTRTFSTDIPQHFHFGRFGWGWSDNWEWSLSVAYDIPGQSSHPGTVTISGPGGSRRVFQPDSRSGRPYIAQPGDNATLTSLGNGVYTLEESDGTLRCFRADGKLDYVQDTHGNRITCVYEGNLLSGLTHSAGPYLVINYTESGCVSAITDSLGRTTSFTYDVSGGHLVLATDYRGLAYSYDYCIGQGLAREHALKEVVNPDGTRTACTYDDRGRLQSKSGGCSGGCCTNYTYSSAGEVDANDGLGGTTRYFFDHRGLLLRTEDALGNISMRTYDDRGQMTKLTDAAGRTQSFTYDALGNRIAETDTLGNTTRYVYDGPFNRLSMVIDAKNNATLYDYESDGDLKSIMDAAGNWEGWTYDNRDAILTWRNRRGQTVTYTNDELGYVTEKRYPDGSVVTFTYDARGNLIQYTDATGTTRQEFDAGDRLIKITYPGGLWLAYTYDSAGRRVTMTDQLGHHTQYHYDDASRLESLTDEAGTEVVHYTYDMAGRVMRKTLGNGVYTTYTYDAAGLITELSNLKPDGSTLSRFAYTYDSRGRRTTMTTTYSEGDPRTDLAGTWQYDYDDAGQLIGWTAPWGRRVDYTYDALGNRLKVQDDGVTTEYTVNNLNQYTQVGSTIRQYDMDGNLSKEIAPNGTTTFSWSSDNKLTGVSGRDISWQNSYDASGNRTQVTDSATVKDHVIDLVGLGNVVGEYTHGAGSLFSSYEFGLGLVAVKRSASLFAYYTGDALGSTSELTDSASNVSNTYVYEPFGTLIHSLEHVTNFFTFTGEYGIVTDRSGLVFMRSRFYSSGDGRFISYDSWGLAGGDLNLVRYAQNDPVTNFDPTGALVVVGGCCGPLPWQDCSDYTEEQTAKLDCYQRACVKHDKTCHEITANNRGNCIWPWNWTKDVRDAWGELQRDWAKCAGTPDPKPAPAPIPTPTPEQAPTPVPPTRPRDPNKKLGPMGQGAAHFVMANGLLPYMVEFENDTTATAPAQIVTITDPLDDDLDWSTFELTEIGFGDTLIHVPAGAQHFETAVPMSFGGLDFEVQIEAGIRLGTGKVYANFYSIDPRTSLPPTVDIGFLLPENGTGRGKGHFSYTIRAKEGLPGGTEIRNIAYITFDGAETVATNQLDPHDSSKGTDPNMECINTIDTGLPSSHVNPLPAVVETAEFVVSWTGEDSASGSGIAGYDIYVSDNGADYVLWMNTSDVNAIFTGEHGHTYRFYSIAIDNVGNHEAAPSGADAETMIGECFPSSYSTYHDWVALGRPNCWCAPPYGSGYQCDGDADGVSSGPRDYYRIFIGDLSLIVANWKKKAGDPTLNPCADIDHKDSGGLNRYRVFVNDLNILVANWKKSDKDLPGNCPRE